MKRRVPGRTPTLAELQAAVRLSLQGADGGAAAWVAADGLDAHARLGIYRNTATGVLVNALRLAFPVVRRLVGAEFFEGAAHRFCGAAPPRSAWLDEYGAAFPAFLAQLPQAAALPYLADVAQLEWQVNAVLHAADARPIDLAPLARLNEAALGGLRLRPHPAVRLQRCEYPADAIWRAVLDQDDRALSAIELGDGPVRLLVQRTADGVDMLRLSDDEWRVTAALFAGEPLHAALTRAPAAAGHALIAAYLARGCFAGTVPYPDGRPDESPHEWGTQA